MGKLKLATLCMIAAASSGCGLALEYRGAQSADAASSSDAGVLDAYVVDASMDARLMDAPMTPPDVSEASDGGEPRERLRLLSPRSGSRIASAHPVVRWHTHPEIESGAWARMRILVCATRPTGDCPTAVDQRVVDATSLSARVDLPSPERGTYFVRLSALDDTEGTVLAQSDTWQFSVVTTAGDSSTADAGTPHGYGAFSWGTRPDFDGDGNTDVAFSLVSTELGAQGQVRVHWGNDTRERQTRSSPSSGGAREFGSTLAACDVNGDGFVDLAIAQPSDTAPAVYVYSGSAVGLSEHASVVIDSARLAEAEIEEIRAFATSLACIGDRNDDGFGDLAIGVPDENTVVIAYGSADGHGALVAQRPLGTIQRDAAFGSTVVGVGDIDHDGLDDYVVGAPHDSAGSIQLILGTGGGLASSGPMGDSLFGSTLATLGPGEPYGIVGMILAVDAPGAGLIQLMRLSPLSFFTFQSTQFLTGRELLPPGPYSLAGGEDVDADNYLDLVVGRIGSGMDRARVITAAADVTFGRVASGRTCPPEDYDPAPFSPPVGIGHAVAFGSNVDGVPSILVGAPRTDPGGMYLECKGGGALVIEHRATGSETRVGTSFAP